MSCPHFCDCDECLNVGGGTRMAGAGVVTVTGEMAWPKWRTARLEAAAEHRRGKRKRKLARAALLVIQCDARVPAGA